MVQQKERTSQNAQGGSPADGDFLRGLGSALMLTVGVLHLVLVREHLMEAVHVGTLFILDGVIAFAAMVGITRGSFRWGWNLGLLAAGGALLMYVEARLVGIPAVSGLPAFRETDWFEPIGILAVVIESVFVVLYLAMLRVQLGYRTSASTGERTDSVAWDSRSAETG